MFRRRKREQDLDRELRDHLSLESAEQQALGLDAGDASRAARRALGNTALIKEDTRATWTARWLDVFLQDLRYGLRTLLRNPGFAAVAILSLALGIGANTAIFTLINALVLKPLPVANPDGLIQILQETPHGPLNKWTFEAYRFFHAQPQLFAGVIAQDNERFDVRFSDEPTPIDGVLVSGDYFPALGVAPLLGRALNAADDAESGGPEGPSAVISYRFWVARFAGDPSILGRTLVVNDTPLRIVGVMPPSFFGIDVGKSPNFFLPLGLEPMLKKSQSLVYQKYAWWLDVLARKRDGLSDSGMQSGLKTIWPRLIHDVVPFQPSRAGFISARNGISDLRKRFLTPLYILMAIAGIVLLIACANVANLLLARTGSRQREIAVRLAVGASRERLLRQLLTESLLLSVLGSLLGLVFAYWGCGSLLALLSTARRTIDLNVHPDPLVLTFTAVIALATAIFFGAGPAFRATAAGPGASLKESAQALARRSVGGPLVIAQTALCLVLLIGAGLFVRTFWNLTNQNLGFDARNVYIALIDPRTAGFQGLRLAQFYAELHAALNARPNIASASFSTDTPIAACCWTQSFFPEGYAADVANRPFAFFNSIAPGFFRTFGTRIVTGRDFNARDSLNTPLAAIVSESVATQFFPGANPLGKHITIGKNAGQQTAEIVGVVENMRTGSLRAGTEYEIYFDMFQSPTLVQMIVEIRSPGGLAQAAALLREQVHALAPRIPLAVDSFSEQVARTALSDRMTALLAAFFGALALLLACVGLYGIMSYSVLRRTGELGVRMALGARASSVILMIVRDAVLLAGMGAAIGIPVALLCSRLMTSLSALLFGIKPTDPPTIAATTVLLIVLAATAGYFPALRAARIDPAKALRND